MYDDVEIEEPETLKSSIIQKNNEGVMDRSISSQQIRNEIKEIKEQNGRLETLTSAIHKLDKELNKIHETSKFSCDESSFDEKYVTAQEDEQDEFLSLKNSSMTRAFHDMENIQSSNMGVEPVSQMNEQKVAQKVGIHTSEEEQSIPENEEVFSYRQSRVSVKRETNVDDMDYQMNEESECYARGTVSVEPYSQHDHSFR